MIVFGTAARLVIQPHENLYFRSETTDRQDLC